MQAVQGVAQGETEAHQTEITGERTYLASNTVSAYRVPFIQLQGLVHEQVDGGMSCVVAFQRREESSQPALWNVWGFRGRLLKHGPCKGACATSNVPGIEGLQRHERAEFQNAVDKGSAVEEFVIRAHTWSMCSTYTASLAAADFLQGRPRPQAVTSH
jgi:hypothetical protein